MSDGALFVSIFVTNVAFVENMIHHLKICKKTRLVMSLIGLASGKSLWRGYEYYTGKRVYMKMKKVENEYVGKVIGNGQTYDVHIDLEHPRKSKCNCPHADGKRIICKHMVALYFDAFPNEAAAYIREVEEYEEEREELQNKTDKK